MKKISLLMAIAIICAGGGYCSAEDYTVITPEALSITQNGWNPTQEGITASSDKWLKITVIASTDSKLTSEHGHVIPYTLTSRDGGSAVKTWEFSPAELHKTGGTTKPVGAIIDLSTARPGTYTTSLTYTVSADIVPGNLVDLSQLTGAYEAQDGDVLTGTAGADAHITIAAGATITLWSADITSIKNDDSHKWAGITCSDDATIILDGTNKVKGGHRFYPGIFISPDHTLTIKGTGSLTASSNGVGAGIGSGYQMACGNIEIEDGNITATGGDRAAGIGSGKENSSCGNITISGGTVKATGGERAAGIGSGYYYASCGNINITGGTVEATGGENAAGIGSGYYYAGCGTIEITSGVTSVTAKKGSNAPNSIGAGQYSSCGTVSIADGANVTQN